MGGAEERASQLGEAFERASLRGSIVERTSGLSDAVDKTSELLGGRAAVTYNTPDDWAEEALPWLAASPPSQMNLKIMYSMEFGQEAQSAKRAFERTNYLRDMIGAERISTTSDNIFDRCRVVKPGTSREELLQRTHSEGMWPRGRKGKPDFGLGLAAAEEDEDTGMSRTGGWDERVKRAALARTVPQIRFSETDQQVVRMLTRRKAHSVCGDSSTEDRVKKRIPKFQKHKGWRGTSVFLGSASGQEVADTEKTVRVHTFFQTVFLLALLVVVVCWYVSSRTWDTRRGVNPRTSCLLGSDEWKRSWVSRVGNSLWVLCTGGLVSMHVVPRSALNLEPVSPRTGRSAADPNLAPQIWEDRRDELEYLDLALRVDTSQSGEDHETPLSTPRIIRSMTTPLSTPSKTSPRSGSSRTTTPRGSPPRPNPHRKPIIPKKQPDQFDRARASINRFRGRSKQPKLGLPEKLLYLKDQDLAAATEVFERKVALWKELQERLLGRKRADKNFAVSKQF